MEKRIRWIPRRSRVPGCSPRRAAFLRRSPAVTSPRRRPAQERDWGGPEGAALAPCPRREAWPGGGPAAALTHQKRSRPGHPWGAPTLLRCVGTVGSGPFPVSRWWWGGVFSTSTPAHPFCARGPGGARWERAPVSHIYYF